jgi:hypothetical protein
MNSLFRHAGPDPVSRRRPDESREPSQRLGPGFHREPWIPAQASLGFAERRAPRRAFAGITILIEAAIYKQILMNPLPIRGTSN